MTKKKKPKKPSPRRGSPPSQLRSPLSSKSVASPASANSGFVPLLATNAQSTAQKADLAIISSKASVPALVSSPKCDATLSPAANVAGSDSQTKGVELVNSASAPLDSRISEKSPIVANSETLEKSKVDSDDSWVKLVKGTSRQLSKKGIAFTLPTGEACVKIPNSVIEKNRKSWECFVIGQFYTDPPSQGTLHNIVNGIWSKFYREVSVSKLDGNAFLFRIPNSLTRNRVINQRLWQIEGQTMFVAKWDPGVVPKKPELTYAPIWLELRNVPLQLFHEEALERIAGLVGEPKFLHPSTANKTNLEVAKIFTMIDPRKPLPKAVNAQFDSGEIVKISVSSPWMPPVYEHCKEIGHSLKRCVKAPATCSHCNSKTHSSKSCHRLKSGPSKHRQQRKPVSFESNMLRNGKKADYVPVTPKPSKNAKSVVPPVQSQAPLQGEASGLTVQDKSSVVSMNSGFGQKDQPLEEGEISSDVLSSDSEDIVSAEDEYENFQVMLSRRQRKDQRGKCLKLTQ